MMISTMSVLKGTSAWLERHAEGFLIGGLSMIGVAQWHKWRQDRKRAEELLAQPLDLPTLKETPRVSVLIAAWNEERNIKPCIESILTLRYANIELLLCAGGTDKTFEIARHYAKANVMLLAQDPGEGKQRALQKCFEKSTGEIIFLTDADCVLDDEAFERLIAPLVNGEEKVTSGSWKPLDRQLHHPFVIFQWFGNAYAQAYMPDYVGSLIGRSAALHRQTLEQVGEFKATVPIGTDLFLSNQLLAAGYQIRFVRESTIRTEYSEDFSSYWGQLSRWFRNPMLLGMKPESQRGILTNLRAGLAALFMLTVPSTIGAGRKSLWYLWLCIGWHLLLTLARMTRFSELCHAPPQRGRWQYLRFLPYMVINWIGTARALLDTFIPARRFQW